MKQPCLLVLTIQKTDLKISKGKGNYNTKHIWKRMSKKFLKTIIEIENSVGSLTAG